MSRAIGWLRVLLRVLLLRFEVLLFTFRFFNWFNHQEPPLLAVMVAAPGPIIVSTQASRGFVARFFPRQFLWLGGSAVILVIRGLLEDLLVFYTCLKNILRLFNITPAIIYLGSVRMRMGEVGLNVVGTLFYFFP
ncbi:hypothetical protein BHE74_00006738 [Ensete ventricosum]|nr:hypothetical protein BHE74_00006738 [Ensete ventricosum]